MIHFMLHALYHNLGEGNPRRKKTKKKKYLFQRIHLTYYFLSANGGELISLSVTFTQILLITSRSERAASAPPTASLVGRSLARACPEHWRMVSTRCQGSPVPLLVTTQYPWGTKITLS